MRLNTLNFHSKLGLSGFLISIMLGLLSAATLIGLLYSSSDSGFNIPEMDKVKAKYSESTLVGAMKTTMYQHVTVDDDIKVMEKWIQAGALENDYWIFKKGALPIMLATVLCAVSPLKAARVSQ